MDTFTHAIERMRSIAEANQFTRWEQTRKDEERKSPRAPEFTSGDLSFRHNPNLNMPKSRLDSQRRARAKGGGKKMWSKS